MARIHPKKLKLISNILKDSNFIVFFLHPILRNLITVKKRIFGEGEVE